MKRSYVENIRKAVKNAGDYKPTAEQIRTAILTVCPNGKNINQNKLQIVAEVINLIESSSQIEAIHGESTTISHEDEDEALSSDISQQGDMSEAFSSDISQQGAMEQASSDSLQQEAMEEVFSSDNNEAIPEETTLTVAQKQDLVAQQASQLQITLSESEIVEVSETLNNQIESRNDFIAEIRNAIRSFIDTKANSQKQEINNFVSETIDYAASKFSDNDQQLKEGLQEINNFFRSDSARVKELSKSISAAFKV